MSGVDSIEAEWLRYFVTLGLESFDTIALDSAAFTGHIDRLADVVFSKGTKLDVLWSSESSKSELSNKKIESEDALFDFLRSSSDQPHTIVLVTLHVIYIFSIVLKLTWMLGRYGKGIR